MMSVRYQHDQQDNSHYFVTFTCYQWLPLFQITNAYDCVYKWFDSLHKKEIRVTGYVIMPNHIHVLLYFPEMKQSLNTVIGNAKRFIAYEMIKRLKKEKQYEILEKLAAGVNNREKKKGQLHKAFEESFEAKECRSAKFIFQKLNYIHRNPVSGKWQLTKDFVDYPYSSASFYETGVGIYDKILHVGEV